MTAAEPVPTDSPELSVVLVTPGGVPEIARTLDHLRAQSVRDRIEVVAVGLDRRSHLRPGDRRVVGELERRSHLHPGDRRALGSPIVAARPSTSLASSPGRTSR